MRISDWSSDVCSSDLGGDKSFNKNHLLNNDLSLRTVEPGASLGQLLLGDPGTIRTCDLRLRRASLYPAELRGQLSHQGSQAGRRHPTHRTAIDRRSVESGKCVSVRVDIDGRRDLKKKQTEQ